MYSVELNIQRSSLIPFAKYPNSYFLNDAAVLLVAAILVGEGDGYCAGAGANPGFKAAPHVEQVL
jgi:hypothetical protein